MYLRVTGLLIEVHVPREVSGHVFTCYRSFTSSKCGGINLGFWAQNFSLSETMQSTEFSTKISSIFSQASIKTSMYLRVTCLLIEVHVRREVSGHVFTCYMSFD
jgi:hypothetical protein